MKYLCILAGSLASISCSDIPPPDRDQQSTLCLPPSTHNHFDTCTWSPLARSYAHCLLQLELREAVQDKEALKQISSINTFRSPLTYASFNVHFVTPRPIFSAVDHFFILSVAWVAPVFSWAVILHCRGIRSGPLTSWVSPVVSAKVIITHSERRLRTVYG